MIDIVISTILPGDTALGMPSASEIDFNEYIAKTSKHGLLEEFEELVQKISKDRLGDRFEMLSNEDRLKAINACKSVNVRLFVDFVTNLFRAYYSDSKVLQIIGSGSIPPFPEGNALPSDDWEILECVYERNKIYRPVKTNSHEVE